MPSPDSAGRVVQLDLFRSSLTPKPYCSDDLTTGLRIRSLEYALRCQYIQPNHPNSKLWLVYDIDRATCIDEITDDLNLPAPHIFVQNPDNLHAHAYYGLETPVHLNPNSSKKAIRFAAAVDCAFTTALDADAQYCGLISKNPLHKRWRTYSGHVASYSLSEMSDFVDLEKYGDRRRAMPETGLGRNVNLFNRLRKWSYKAIRQGWPDVNQWHQACLDRAIGYNKTDNPLPSNEVRQTSVSVAKWTHKNFTSEGFSELQSVRGSMKGQKVRDEKLEKAVAMREAGMSIGKIAQELEKSKSTIQSWLKSYESHIR